MGIWQNCTNPVSIPQEKKEKPSKIKLIRNGDTNRGKLAKLCILLVLLKDEHKVRLPCEILSERDSNSKGKAQALMDHIFSCRLVSKDKSSILGFPRMMKVLGKELHLDEMGNSAVCDKGQNLNQT